MPSDTIQYLTLEEALAIHQRLLDTFGGPAGVRDMGMLESALYRPRSGYYSDLTEMAAALFESLLMNHPFVDGNKRMAFFSTDIFLRINGYRFVVEPEPTYQMLLEWMEARSCDFTHLLPWIRASIKPI